jgi:hypothetical protein
MTMFLKIILSSSLFFLATTVFAQEEVIQLQSIAQQLGAQSSSGGLGDLINQIFYVVLAVAIVLAVSMVIRGGYEYMTSSDSGDKKSRAKRRIQAAFGGLLLAVGSVVILNSINRGITNFSISFPQLQGVQLPPELQDAPSSGNFINPDGTYSGEYFAEFLDINNPEKLNASADGVIVLNGTTYYFRSGGGGRGYLPAGTYEVTNGRERNDVSSMIVDGYGYSFDLSNKYDDRVGDTRTNLRIHPDGGNAGTAGCIGIQGGGETQRNFYEDLNAVVNQNGGSYTISVGQ